MPTVPQVEHSILAKIAKKFGQKWVNQKNEIFVGSHISKFLRPLQRYDDFKLIRITCQATVMAKLNMAYLSSLKNRAKLLLSSLPVSPSRFLPTVPQVEHSILAKIAKKFGQKWVNQKNEIFVGSHISKFLRPLQRYDDFKLIRITCQAAVMAKLNMAYLSSLKNRAKLLLSSLPVSPSRFLPTVPQVEHSILAKIAKKFGQKWVNQKNEIFVGSHISKFLRPSQRYDDFKLIRITCQAAVMAKLNMAYLSSLKKPSKTAVVLISGVTISGTPCPRDIIGAEVPSGHVAQA